MFTPGRPHEPTIHPRTRPEGEEIAAKMRSTHDWFRHDGKNVEVTPPPEPRTGWNKEAVEIHEKAKGEPDQWFEHDAANPSDPSPAPRCPSQESKVCHDKIYGKEEAWYKHEENRDYNSPRPGSRGKAPGAEDITDQRTKADTNNWYRHDHGKGDEFTPEKPPQRNPHTSPYATEFEEKIQGGGTPDWYAHNGKRGNGHQNGDEEAGRSHSRLTNPDAEEYQLRQRTGAASEWYSHDHANDDSSPDDIMKSPRVTSSEANEIASRLKGESPNWFNHEANKNYSPTKPGQKGPSSAAHRLMEKSRGGDMQHVFHHNENKDSRSPEPQRVKPDAEEVSRSSAQGLMSKYLNQEGNKDYQSARPVGRSIKPEAEEAFEKNKGVMGDVMGGYPAEAPKRDANRVKSEAQQYADRNKGSMSTIFGDNQNAANSARPVRVKSEAANNAERNKGSLDTVMYGTADMSIGNSNRPARRNVSTPASQAAERGQSGSIGGLLGMSS